MSTLAHGTCSVASPSDLGNPPMAYTILGKVLVLSSDIQQDPGGQVARRWLLQSAGVPNSDAPHYC